MVTTLLLSILSCRIYQIRVTLSHLPLVWVMDSRSDSLMPVYPAAVFCGDIGTQVFDHPLLPLRYPSRRIYALRLT
jgi:hypothetical protein